MTVATLKKKLENCPDELEVFLAERKTEFKFGLVNSVRRQHIDFYEDVGDEEPIAENVEVIILDEE